ncbi:MAG: SMI1/KNR4 family protein [Armatimonadota bacterium]
MPTIEDMILRLEAAGFRFHLPATPEDIRAMETALGCALPPEIAALYWHGNGMEQFTPDDYPDDHRNDEGDNSESNEYDDENRPVRQVYRLMSSSEVIEMHPRLVEFGINTYGCCAFWTDDENYAATVYVEGPLEGRVGLLIEDDGSGPWLVFRSVFSFLEAVAACGKSGFLDWLKPSEDHPVDYPALAPLSPEETEADLAAAEGLRQMFVAADDADLRKYYAYRIIDAADLDTAR